MNSTEIKLLESKIEVLFDINTSKSQIDSLTEYFQSLKSKNNFKFLFECILSTQKEKVNFYLLDMLISIVAEQYNHFSQNELAEFRSALLYLIQNYTQVLISKRSTKGKFCSLFVTFIIFDFPENNNEMFKQLVEIIFSQTDSAMRIAQIELFIQIMNVFDDDLVQFRHTYDTFYERRSTIIKDYVRENELQRIVLVLSQVIENASLLANNFRKMVFYGIKAISKLIDWNPVGEFDTAIRCSIGLLEDENIYGDALAIVFGVCKKKMDVNQKLMYINEYKITEALMHMAQQTRALEGNFYFLCESINQLGLLFFVMTDWLKQAPNECQFDAKVLI